jgi:hypothetical protein
MNDDVVNLFETLDDNHKKVDWSEANQAWFFYDTDEDEAGEQILGDGQHYETSEDAAYAACSFYGYI